MSEPCVSSRLFLFLSQVYLLWFGDSSSSSSSSSSASLWSGATPAYWFAFGVYVLSGALMAVCSVWLVLTYAKFARASGLPEIKTVVGGVVWWGNDGEGLSCVSCIEYSLLCAFRCDEFCC